jgi:fucose 4-O-acetylase-like acetyltransferase
MEIFMRKHYLDNIRFLTIFFVVIFHVYFYYNNIGTEAMFAGLKPYEGAVTFAGIYQYFVYPWFMLLLFVVAGISARYALEKRTERQFLKERVDKILAPSTLGVLAFGWLGGYVIYLHTARGNMPESVPAFVRVIIILCCGIGALWFCHVLFVAALIENVQRANMSPTEEAEAAAKILGRCQGDRDETARRLGWSRSTLDKRLALMNCSEKVRRVQPTRVGVTAGSGFVP